MTASPHRVVRASAGSGKTHRLSMRYLELLLQGASPRTVLATTFTRKAAGEILERILSRLSGAVLDPSERAALGRDLGVDLDAQTADRLLVELTDSLHRLAISTLDAFFYRIARSLRAEIGMERGFRVSPGDDELERWRRREALDLSLESLADEAWSDLEKVIDDLQQGSAGRSVTFSLDMQLSDLLELYAQAPSEDLWRRLEVPESPSEEEISSALENLGEFAATCKGARLLKGLTGSLEDAAAGDWKRVLEVGITAKFADNPTQPSFGGQAVPSQWWSDLEVLVVAARSAVVAAVADQTLATWRMVSTFDHCYRSLRKRAGVLLFSDLSREILEVGLLRPESLPDLYYRLDGWVEHLLLDEFQDTSRAQWEVLKPIAEEIRSHGDGSRTFFCVGDPKQAIYGWRGGCSDLFDQLMDDLQLDEDSEESMSGSYRSSVEVLDFVNRFFARLSEAVSPGEYGPATQRWMRGFERHHALRPEPGYVEVVTLPAVDAEETVASRVGEWVERLPGASLAVLARTNRQVVELLEALHLAGVAASAEAGVLLADDPSVALVQSLLLFGDHPGDSVSRYHLEHSPLAPRLMDSEEDGEASWPEIARRQRRRWVALGPTRWMQEATGRILDDVAGTSKAMMSQALRVAADFEAGDGRRMADLAEALASARVQDAAGQGVRVMTIHKAKGLEFDVVVLPLLDRGRGRGRQDGILLQRDSPLSPVQGVFRNPSKSARAASPQLSEAYRQEKERRFRDDLSTFYVALTRARRGLLVWPLPSEGHVPRGTPNFSELLYLGLDRQAVEAASAGHEVVYLDGDLSRWGSARNLDRGAARSEKTQQRQPEQRTLPFFDPPDA